MNLFLKKLFYLLSLIGCFTILACNGGAGLGEAIDLESPVITVTSPEKFSYQHCSFTMKGTCTDNKGVTKVVISNKESGKVYGNAVITGDEWSFDVKLDKEEEGEVTFLCTAHDEFGNSSTKSARTVTYLVDEHAPEGLAWYVERGNSIQSNLKDKEELENLDYTLAVNKDVPQNEEFYIHGSFYDAMSIDTITLKLFEDSSTTPVIEQTVTATPGDHYIGDGKSIYSPVFHFTQADLVQKDSSLATGKHYLRIGYYSRDNDSLENANEDETDTGMYVLWWPESDKPGIQQISIVNDKITVSIGSQIPIDFFDDDALSEIHYSLRNSITGTPEQYVNSLVSSSSTRTTAFTPQENQPAVSTIFSDEKQRDVPCQIEAPGIPCQMYLVAAAKDIRGKWKARVIPLEVTDENKPLLFVESPSQNTIPEIKANTDSTFEIKGYSLDTKGSSYIKIVYIPNDPNDPDNAGNNTSAKKEERAKALLETYKTDTSAKKVIYNSSSQKTGEVIWYQKFTTNNITSGWNKQQFTISMDLLTDFVNSNGQTTAKERKFFEICIEDSDGNKVYKPFILLGDSISPSIEIFNPEKELSVHDYTQSDLVIEFMGKKNSGLGIDTSKYKVTTTIGNNSYEYTVGHGLTVNSTTKRASVTISKATLKEWFKVETQPTFTFYATDTLGNGGNGEGQRSVILSERPTILSILTPGKSGDITCKAGDEITFKVSFSKQVKVTGTPRLKLKYSSTDTTYKYANYYSGSGTNGLLFKFTVPQGATSTKLLCDGFDTASENKFPTGIKIQATELGEGDIYTSIASAKMFTEDTTIAIDGILPTIKSITVTPADGNYYCKKGKTINAVVEFTENISVSSNPSLILKVGNSNLNFTTQSIGDNEITFIHQVTNSDPQGTISSKFASAFTSANTAAICDGAGNSLSLSNTKEETSTVVIDYTAPSVTSSLPLSGTYNNAQNITISGIESGAKAYYSKDAGASWTLYNSASPENLGSGSYDITTYQEDLAGNKSATSAIQSVVINNNFPNITNLSINISDGQYQAGTVVPIAIDFEDDIMIYNATDVQIVLASKADSSITKTLNVTVPSSHRTSKLEYSYTVAVGDTLLGLQVKEIIFADSVADAYGNKPAYSGTPKKLTESNCTYLTAPDGGNREGISLDGVLPTISGFNPVNNGVCSATNNENFKITLTFSENVAKEYGEIILQRKGDWAIPAVLTETEYNNYYLKMTAANQEKLIKTDSAGSPVLGYKSGMPVGPYQKIPQGLKLENGSYVPDKSVKFVLVYDLGLYSGTASLNDGTETGTFTASVADIRNALKSVDFDKHKVDVSSDFVKITNNVVEITFPDVIEDGREWELYIPNTAFRDNAANFYKGMSITGKTVSGATDTYTLWSNKVAKPVVRLDKYSHGWGAREPKADGTLQNITSYNAQKSGTIANNTGCKIAPTGYARVRVDCETPNVTLKYEIKNSGTSDTSTTGKTQKKTGTVLTYYPSTIGDITNLTFSGSGTAYTQGNDILVGDGSYTTARKDYVTSKATKSGFADSEYGYEGVFKTVVYFTDTKKSNNIANIQGGTAAGGMPNIDGFPLRDATSDNRYAKNCYCIGGSKTNLVWVTYEIVSTDFAMLVQTSNYSQKYPLNSYGQMCVITSISFY